MAALSGFTLVDVEIFLCVATVVWALVPRADVVTLKLGTVPRSGGLLPQMPRKRQSPFAFLFRRIGRLVPHGRWSEEFRMAPLYPGSQLSVEEFRGVRVLAVIAAGVLYAVIGRELGVLRPMGFGIAAAFGLVMPQLWVRGQIAKRNRAIVRLLPEVIDLLSLCVGAGVDFLGALNRVVSVREYHREPLVEEFSLALQEMKLGKRKSDALKAMARRVNLQELTSFVRAVVLADRMGTPIADVLAVHAEDVRMQRFNRAERAALKAPIKLLFPLVFGIMPCVGIIVGAPVFLQFARLNAFGAMK